MYASLLKYGAWLVRFFSIRTLVFIILCLNLLAIVVLFQKNTSENGSLEEIRAGESPISEETHRNKRQGSVSATEGKDCKTQSPFKGLDEVDVSQGRQSVAISWGVYRSLSKYSLRKVQKFVFITGNSGALDGVLGTVLNAHPHAVLAPLPKLLLSLNGKSLKFTEDERLVFYNQISRYAFSRAHTHLHEMEENRGKPKSWHYSVLPNLYSGVYEGHINIIGLDISQNFAESISQNPDEVDHAVKQLFALVGIPLVVLHEVQNPFDSIALIACNILSTDSDLTEEEGIRRAILTFFSLVKSFETFRMTHSYVKVVNVHAVDLRENPVKTLQSVCHQLGIFCSDEFTLGSANMIRGKTKAPRMSMSWSKVLVGEVQSRISQYQHLERYNFTSNHVPTSK